MDGAAVAAAAAAAASGHFLRTAAGVYLGNWATARPERETFSVFTDACCELELKRKIGKTISPLCRMYMWQNRSQPHIIFVFFPSVQCSVTLTVRAMSHFSFLGLFWQPTNDGDNNPNELFRTMQTDLSFRPIWVGAHTHRLPRS